MAGQAEAKDNTVTVTPFVCCLTAGADLTTVLWSLDMRCRRRVGGMDLYLSLPIAAIYAVFLGPTELEFRFPRASMLEHETGPRCGNTHSAISPFKGWYTFKTSPPICPPPFRPPRQTVREVTAPDEAGSARFSVESFVGSAREEVSGIILVE